MISVSSDGLYKKTRIRLDGFANRKYLNEELLKYFGEKGVSLLAEATPTNTGYTASCWYYEIKYVGNKVELNWGNTNMAGTVPVVILLDRGHGTVDGKYVAAKPFIKEAIRPVIEEINNYIQKEVET